MFIGIVHAGKTDLRILFRSHQNRIPAGKADRPAELIAVVHQGLQVGGVIAALFGLDIGNRGTGIIPELQHSLPGTLVEGLVVDPAYIRDHGDLAAGAVYPAQVIDRRGQSFYGSLLKFQQEILHLCTVSGRIQDARLDLLADLESFLIDLIRVIGVFGRNTDGIVREAEDHGLSSNFFAENVELGNRLDGDVDIFKGRGQDVVRSQIGLVAVDADGIFAVLLGRLDNTDPGASCRVIDDVTAVCREHLVGNALALCGIGKALRILDDHTDLLAQHFIRIGHARFIAVLELVDGIAVDAAHKADLLRLGNGRCYISDHEGRLLCPEDDACHIRGRIIEGIVHDGKMDVRIVGGGLQHSVRGRESDGPAERIAVIDQGLEVGREISALLGLDITDLRVRLFPEFLQTLPGALVEGLVIDPASICDHGDLPARAVHVLYIQIHSGRPCATHAACPAAGQFARADEPARGKHQRDAQGKDNQGPSAALSHNSLLLVTIVTIETTFVTVNFVLVIICFAV